MDANVTTEDAEDPVKDVLARAEKSGAARGLRRVQNHRERAQRVRAATRRHQRLWVIPVLVYAAMVPLFGWVPAIVALVVGMLLLSLSVQFVRSPDAMASLGITGVTLVVVATVIAPMHGAYGSIEDGAVPGSTVFVALCLPLVAYTGVYWVNRYVPRRWAYVLAGCIGSLVAMLVAVPSPVWGTVLGIVWVLGVVMAASGFTVWWKARRARWRSGVKAQAPIAERRKGLDLGGKMSDRNLEAGVEAELRTAAHLLDLPEGWTVLHSREVPGSNADLDHVVVGPAGVFLVDSKNWKGTIESTLVALNGDDGEPREPVAVPVLDERPERLPERMESAMFEASAVARALGIGPQHVTVVVSFTKKMKMPDGPQTLWLDGVVDPRTGSERSASVRLLHADELVPWLSGLPSVKWYRRSLWGQLVDKVRGGVAPEVDERRQRRFMEDLGAVADYVLPPQD